MGFNGRPRSEGVAARRAARRAGAKRPARPPRFRIAIDPLTSPRPTRSELRRGHPMTHRRTWGSRVPAGTIPYTRRRRTAGSDDRDGSPIGRRERFASSGRRPVPGQPRGDWPVPSIALPRQGGVRTARRTSRGTDTSRSREGEPRARLEPLLESRDPGREATRSPTAPRVSDGVECRRARARGSPRSRRLSRRRAPAPPHRSAPPHTRPGSPWPPVPSRAVPTRAEPRGRTPTAGALPHGRETLWGPSPGLSSKTVPRCEPICHRYPKRMWSR